MFGLSAASVVLGGQLPRRAGSGVVEEALVNPAPSDAEPLMIWTERTVS